MKINRLGTPSQHSLVMSVYASRRTRGHAFLLLLIIAVAVGVPKMAQAYDGLKPQSSPVDNNSGSENGSAKHKVGSVEQMLHGLRTKLRSKPDDVKGWVLLARSYHHVGDWHEAEKAAAKARALGYEGSIFPDEKNQAVVSGGDARPKVPNDHHHRGLAKDNAGNYVSSFFETLESESIAQPSAEKK